MFMIHCFVKDCTMINVDVKCIVIATGIGIQCYLFGGFSATARAKIFNKEFFEKKFPTLPKNERQVRKNEIICFLNY